MNSFKQCNSTPGRVDERIPREAQALPVHRGEQRLLGGLMTSQVSSFAPLGSLSPPLHSALWFPGVMPVGSPIGSSGGSSGIKMFISWSLPPTQRHRDLAVSLDRRPFPPGRLHYKMLLALDLPLLLRLLLQVTLSPVVQLHKSNIFTTRISALSYPIRTCHLLSWDSVDTRVR